MALLLRRPVVALGEVGGRCIGKHKDWWGIQDVGQRHPVHEVGGGLDPEGTTALHGQLERPVGQNLGRGDLWETGADAPAQAGPTRNQNRSEADERGTSPRCPLPLHEPQRCSHNTNCLFHLDGLRFFAISFVQGRGRGKRFRLGISPILLWAGQNRFDAWEKVWLSRAAEPTCDLMKEVSCRLGLALYEEAQKEGVSAPQIMKGVDLDPAFLKNTRQRIDWGDYARMMRNVREGLGRMKQLEDFGEVYGRQGSGLNYIARIGGLFASPRALFDLICRWVAPANVSHVVMQYELLPSGVVRFWCAIPPEMEDSPEYLHSSVGVCRVLPTFIGMPKVRVDAVVKERYAEYLIHIPPSRTLWAKLGRGWQALRGGGAVLELLQAQHQELTASHATLEQQQKDLRRLIDNLGDGIVLLRGGQVRYANQAFARHLGQAGAEQLSGQPLNKLMPEDEAVQWERHLAGARKGGRGEAIELFFNRRPTPETPSSSPVLLELRPSAAIEFEGRECEVWLARDCTERRAVDEALAQAAEHERRRLAHELHDGVGQQLSGIALKAFALSQSLQGEAQREAALDISELANDTVAQTRSLAQGLSPVDVVGGGLGRALQQLAQTTSELFAMDCSCQLPPDEISASPAVALELYRIVQEAITNAHRHGKASAVRVSLEAQPQDWMLRVCDNGLGLKPKTDGQPGMGLRIMKHRAQTAGGTVTLQANQPTGTMVEVRLPSNVLRLAPRPKPAGDPEVAHGTRGEPAARIRVVLVDDHAVLRAGLKQLLEQTGRYEVCDEVAARAGILKSIAQHQPEVAILDLTLSDGDTLVEVSGIARQFPHVRLLMLSMHTAAVQRGRALAAGVHAYVEKQSSPSLLLEELERLTQR